MSFKNPTYIVLDLPKEVSEKVMKIRVANKDEFRASLPVEITITGSTGVGVISNNQSEEFVYEEIKKIASRTKPIKLVFSHVEQVRDTGIYVLKLKDESKLRMLHNDFKNVGIKYAGMEYGYSPHCTLRSRKPITDNEIKKLQETKIEDEFIVDTLSVYMLDKLPITKKMTVKLTGK